MTQVARRGTTLVVSLLLTVGCGSSGGGTPAGPSTRDLGATRVEAAAGAKPALTGVKVTSKTREGNRARYTLEATAIDGDQDLVGGQVRIRLPGGSAAVTAVIAAPLGQRRDADAGSVTAELRGSVGAATLDGTRLQVTLFLDPAPTSAVQLAVSLRDAAGNRSAEQKVVATPPPRSVGRALTGTAFFPESVGGGPIADSDFLVQDLQRLVVILTGRSDAGGNFAVPGVEGKMVQIIFPAEGNSRGVFIDGHAQPSVTGFTKTIGGSSTIACEALFQAKGARLISSRQRYGDLIAKAEAAAAPLVASVDFRDADSVSRAADQVRRQVFGR